jgi:hypothetical protein
MAAIASGKKGIDDRVARLSIKGIAALGSSLSQGCPSGVWDAILADTTVTMYLL